MLIYIRDNKTLGFNYYSEMKDAPLSDLLIQDSINTENQLVDFPYSIRRYCSDTGIITGSSIIFYQGSKIEHVAHVPGPFSLSRT